MWVTSWYTLMLLKCLKYFLGRMSGISDKSSAPAPAPGIKIHVLRFRALVYFCFLPKVLIRCFELWILAQLKYSIYFILILLIPNESLLKVNSMLWQLHLLELRKEFFKNLIHMFFLVSTKRVFLTLSTISNFNGIFLSLFLDQTKAVCKGERVNPTNIPEINFDWVQSSLTMTNDSSSILYNLDICAVHFQQLNQAHQEAPQVGHRHQNIHKVGTCVTILHCD